MFLDNKGLGSDWCVIRDLSRREGYGENAISRATIQRDPKENIRGCETKRPRKRRGCFYRQSSIYSDRGCRCVAGEAGQKKKNYSEGRWRGS
jgi:hypothetical protein